jgi:excisionase family DNA binding protein
MGRIYKVNRGSTVMKAAGRLDRIEEEMSMIRVSEAVSVGVAASELGVSSSTVRNWIEKGYLHAVQLPSGHRRIPESEVRRLMGQMFDFGVPQEEPSTPVVSATPVDSEEEWGP